MRFFKFITSFSYMLRVYAQIYLNAFCHHSVIINSSASSSLHLCSFQCIRHFRCCILHSDWSFFMVPMSFFMLLSILITIILNSTSNTLLTSISSIYFSGKFSYSFIWGLFLYLLILATSLCLFLCIRQIYDCQSLWGSLM